MLKRRLRILFFAHSSVPYGAERCLTEMISCISKDKELDVSVVFPRDGPCVDTLRKIGIHCVVYPYRFWISNRKSFIRIIYNSLITLRAFFFFIRRFRKERPDIICTNTAAIPIGAFVARYLHIPHVWFVHEFLTKNTNFSFDFGEKSSLHLIDSMSNRIVFVSRTVAKEYNKQITTEKTTVLPPGNISLPPMSIKTNTKNHSHFRCLTLGSLEDNKNQNEAIEAVYLLKDKIPDIELVIAGSSESLYIHRLKKKVFFYQLENHVYFLPFQDNPYSSVKDADVLLVCSKQEALPRVIIEAMLSKRPVIASHVGGIPELIHSGKTGLTYKSGDVHDLAEKIVSLYLHPEKRKTLAKNAFLFAQQFHNPKKYHAQIMSLFHEVLR